MIHAASKDSKIAPNRRDLAGPWRLPRSVKLLKKLPDSPFSGPPE